VSRISALVPVVLAGVATVPYLVALHSAEAAPEVANPCHRPLYVQLSGRLMRYCQPGAEAVSWDEVRRWANAEACPAQSSALDPRLPKSAVIVLDSCELKLRILGGKEHLVIGIPIDINRADALALQALARIGPKLAERIVQERQLGGAFRRIEDLARVKGIGPKTVSRLAPHIVAGGHVGAGAE
jgi:competence ComEA-like helix-hairpin-helix protein